VDNNTVGSDTGIINLSRSAHLPSVEHFTHADDSAFTFGNNDASIALWVSAVSLGTNGSIVVKGDGDDMEYDLHYNGTRFAWRLSSATGFANLTTVVADTFGAVSTDTWYFLVARHDSVNNLIEICVNDGPVDDEAYSAGSYSSAAPFAVCNWPAFGIGWFGRVDLLGIWNDYRLSAEEITWMYNGGAARSYADIVAGMLPPVDPTRMIRPSRRKRKFGWSVSSPGGFY
jgi:hypothetical protein